MDMLIDKMIHLQEVKRNNEARVTMQELTAGRYAAAYKRLCAELDEVRESLKQECASHIKHNCPGTDTEAQCAARIFVRFCGLGQADDAGWRAFVETVTKTGATHQSGTLNRMLQFIALDLDERSKRRAE